MLDFFKKIIIQIKQYFQILSEILIISVVEKLSNLIVFILSSFFALFFIALGFLFFSIAFSIYLNDLLKDKYIGFLMVGITYFILGLMVYKFKNKLFSKFVIKHILKIFEDKKNEA